MDEDDITLEVGDSSAVGLGSSTISEIVTVGSMVELLARPGAQGFAVIGEFARLLVRKVESLTVTLTDLEQRIIDRRYARGAEGKWGAVFNSAVKSNHGPVSGACLRGPGAGCADRSEMGDLGRGCAAGNP